MTLTEYINQIKDLSARARLMVLGLFLLPPITTWYIYSTDLDMALSAFNRTCYAVREMHPEAFSSEIKIDSLQMDIERMARLLNEDTPEGAEYRKNYVLKGIVEHNCTSVAEQRGKHFEEDVAQPIRKMMSNYKKDN